MIGKLQRVDLREVWRQEVDFTRWLEENLESLSETVHLSLSGAEREQTAGTFSVDLVAQDDAGDPVVIECQLEQTDHDHLGKLVTYLSAIGAKTGIWIAADPRPEHVGAVSWLNETSAAAFHLVKVEAFRVNVEALPIGESPLAPLLTLIVGPSEEIKKAGETITHLAESAVIRRRFWTQLLDRAKEKTTLHSGISPGTGGWIGASAGMSGLGLNYVIGRHEGRVELFIAREQEAENKAIFDTIAKSKEEIEATFGGPLLWQRLEGRKACRIAYRVEAGGHRDPEGRWPEIEDAMIDAMMRLEKALRPHINGLKL